MKKRHKAEEVIRILREVDVAPTVAEGIRKQGISEQTYYRWRKKYGGMSVAEGKRLKELENENARLKKMLAEQLLINEGLQEINRKKW